MDRLGPRDRIFRGVVAIGASGKAGGHIDKHYCEEPVADRVSGQVLKGPPTRL
jgi:hypothetical protein